MGILSMQLLSNAEIWVLSALFIGLVPVISVGIYAWRQAHKHSDKNVTNNH